MYGTGKTIRRMTRTAMCSALLSVCAVLTIPLPAGIPLTLQTFGVALCGYLLCPAEAVVAVGVYLLLGAAGLPVFSGMRGGFPILFGVSGGFLWGFLPLALLCASAKKLPVRILCSAAGLLLCDLFGSLCFSYQTGTAWAEAVKLCVLPFLLKDAGSLLCAALLAERLRRTLPLLSGRETH